MNEVTSKLDRLCSKIEGLESTVGESTLEVITSCNTTWRKGIYIYNVHVLMRDEKEGRKKQARSNKQHVHVIYA